VNRRQHFKWIAALLILGWGCNDGHDPAAGCTSNSSCNSGQVCVDGFCKGAPNDGFNYTNDSGSTLETKTATDSVEADTTSPEDAPPADNTPPSVVQITPLDGSSNVSAPFSVQVSFSESLKVGLDKNTFTVTNINGVPLQGSYSSNDDQSTWSFIPANELDPASPYDIVVNFPVSAIMDFAGNKMQGVINSRFYTAPPSNLASYRKLALKYAPVVYLETSSSNTQLDYLTPANLDGDWQVTNNKAHVKKASTKTLLPAVHSAVIESLSHYFFHYAYYWPTRSNSAGMESFENDAAGTTVVVEKWSNQGAGRPVEVLTWYKKKSAEYVRAFVTNESNIFTAADTGKAISDSFDGIHTEESLFPGNQVINWLSTGTHESCAWVNDGSNYGCELNAAKRKSMNFLELTVSEQAAPISKESKWPTNGHYGYELVDLLDSWWPRRSDFGTLFYESISTYTYAFGSEKAGVNYPRYFVGANGEQGKGRAIWAVKWQPSEPNKSYSTIKSGAYFFDPAHFLTKRHKTSYFNTSWNRENKSGFSHEYCFNPYLGIDKRGTSVNCP